VRVKARILQKNAFSVPVFIDNEGSAKLSVVSSIYVLSIPTDVITKRKKKISHKEFAFF
jgi:hypothetical protein